MGYRIQGLLHARIYHLLHACRSQTGQGTVEYVALLFLLGAVFAAVVAAGKNNQFGVADKIEQTLKKTLDAVGKG